MIQTKKIGGRRFVPVVAAVALLLTYGIAQGWWMRRWSDTSKLYRAVEQLNGLPANLGNWSGQPLTLTQREIEIGQISGYYYRRFVQPYTGKAMTVLLVCGQPGPIAAHSPEVCFEGAGYKEVAPPVRRQFEVGRSGHRGEFWSAAFRKDAAALPDPLHVTWSWTTTGYWQAASAPRFRFAAEPVLFKLYVVQHLGRLDEPGARETSDQFMRLLLPELQRTLFKLD